MAKKDPIETQRRKLAEAMEKRKTERLARLQREAPPPEERPQVVVLVQPPSGTGKPSDLESLLAQRMAEARKRLRLS